MPHLPGSAAALILHPETGEIFDRLEQTETDLLAELCHALKADEDQARNWRVIVEGELAHRLREKGRSTYTAGQWEISYKAPRQSHWDPDDTEAALQELKARGWIEAVEAVGVIHQPPREVRRAAAKSLLGRLHGPARALLERCCTWSDGTPKLTVTESVQLLEEPREP